MKVKDWIHEDTSIEMPNLLIICFVNVGKKKDFEIIFTMSDKNKIKISNLNKVEKKDLFWLFFIVVSLNSIFKDKRENTNRIHPVTQ